MTNPAVRIACVGAGHWGKNLARNFHDLGALAAISESSPERQREFQERYPALPVSDRWHDTLADPAIAGVAIATPAETHGRLVREALLAGKDVFVEKPLCLAVAEGRELVRLAAEQERILMVGHLL